MSHQIRWSSPIRERGGTDKRLRALTWATSSCKGSHAAQRETGVQDLRDAKRVQEQRHCLPDLVFRAAPGERVVDRRGMALDPDEYFFVVPNMPGNGLSTSPSNTPPPYGKARFTNVAIYDNVSLQKLVTEHFGIERLALVTSWSMGVGQTYQWAVVLPASLGVRQDLVRPWTSLKRSQHWGLRGSHPDGTSRLTSSVPCECRPEEPSRAGRVTRRGPYRSAPLRPARTSIAFAGDRPPGLVFRPVSGASGKLNRRTPLFWT